MSKLKVFEYNQHKITFDFGDGNRMVNATQMSMPFKGKAPAHFLRLKPTKAFIEAYKSQDANPHLEKIIKVIYVGKHNRTWLDEKMALKYAAWLSPEFELWIFDNIQELLHQG